MKLECFVESGIMMSAAFCRVEFDIQIVWSTSFIHSRAQFEGGGGGVGGEGGRGLGFHLPGGSESETTGTILFKCQAVDDCNCFLVCVDDVQTTKKAERKWVWFDLLVTWELRFTGVHLAEFLSLPTRLDQVNGGAFTREWVGWFKPTDSMVLNY